jgi:hypothetical protein
MTWIPSCSSSSCRLLKWPVKVLELELQAFSLLKRVEIKRINKLIHKVPARLQQQYKLLHLQFKVLFQGNLIISNTRIVWWLWDSLSKTLLKHFKMVKEMLVLHLRFFLLRANVFLRIKLNPTFNKFKLQKDLPSQMKKEM